MKKMNLLITLMLAVLFMAASVQSVSAQIKFDDPKGRYEWVKDAQGNKILTSTSIFPQPKWTAEIEKTLTYKTATQWGFANQMAWNEQRTTAALTVLNGPANIGCNSFGCYLEGCYENQEHNRVLPPKGNTTTTIVEKTPPPNIVFSPQINTEAIAQAIAQAKVEAPKPVDLCPNIPGLQTQYPPNVHVDLATGQCVENVVLIDNSDEEVDEAGPCEGGTWDSAAIGGGVGAGVGGGLGKGKRSRALGAGVGGGFGALIGGLTKNRCLGAVVGAGTGGTTAILTRRRKKTVAVKTDPGNRGGRPTSNATPTGPFIPATTTTPSNVGPPLIISVTPINSGGTGGGIRP